MDERDVRGVAEVLWGARQEPEETFCPEEEPEEEPEVESEDEDVESVEEPEEELVVESGVEEESAALPLVPEPEEAGAEPFEALRESVR